MSSVVSALTGGVSGNSGAAGINYQASQANIMQPVTQGQINQSMTDVATQQQQQQALLQALQQQNGIGNQSAVYNQLQGVANGTGPNPAQAQLAQATGQNVANQASLMAGQRGSSQNVGLIARQSAQQGAATQQQAAGQAASMQAQQSLGALGQLGSLATQQVGQQIGQQAQNVGTAQAQQGQLLGAAAAYNSAQTGSQASVNTSNAGIAGQVAGQQANLFGNLVGGGAGALAALAKGGEVRKPMATGGPSSASPFDSSISGVGTVPSSTPATTPTATPGPMSRLGKYMQSNYGTASQQSAQGGPSQQQSPFAQGFQTGNKLATSVQGWFGGQSSAQSNPNDPNAGMATYNSQDPNAMMGSYDSQDPTAMNPEPDLQSPPPTAAGASSILDTGEELAMAKGGKVPALLSPGERYLSPKDVKKVEKGANPMKEGKKVPGTPKVKGAKNSYANDTVKATLDEGGIVLPRSVTQHKNPEWAAHAFVRGIMSKSRQGLKK